jgi:hypothetical protein
MKLTARQKRDRALTLATGFSLFFVLPRALCEIFPEWSFRLVTGRKVPPNVRVLEYESCYTDNLFYRSRFWLLQGDAGDLAKVMDGSLFILWGKAPFGPQDEPFWSVPDTEELFGVKYPGESLSAVYLEGESGIRSRAYWIFEFEKTAVFRK